MSKYADWIRANVEGNGYGKCKKYVDQMKQVFPELVVRRGFYHCPIWNERQHWWLEAEDGSIIDPTAEQFPSKGGGRYEPLNDDELEDRVPTGVCMDCGKPVYHHALFCSAACEESTRSYLETMPNEIFSSDFKA